ncbi:MAG: D-cysteine desulfhydrase family protein [Alphaproteobacteria bacterium]|nr:D-cysteine desulfhydrase family protein [Alphaproteobacteria bacterium]
MTTIEQLAARLGRLPRVPLAHLPTPVEKMERLTAHLGGPTLWIKRDDCTGLGLGGNKVRKLEFLLADALMQRADTVVTGGVVQSNHIRQTAAAAAKLGLECHLAVMTGRVPDIDPDYGETGNILLDRLFGAHCVFVDWKSNRNAVIAALIEGLKSRGKRPYMVAYGGSSALGACGFVAAAMELVQQLDDGDLRITHIVHASGSAGTQAGLAVGLAATAPEIELIGIDVDAEPERVRADVERLARQTADMLGVAAPAPVTVLPGYAGSGYGVPTEAMVDAVRLGARLEGLVLDPVYSGKGFAGLIDLVRRDRFKPEDNVLFWHTGGAPGLFAYRSFF